MNNGKLFFPKKGTQQGFSVVRLGKRYIVVLLLFVFICVITFAYVNISQIWREKSLDTALKRALLFTEQKQIDAAIGEYDKIVAINPNNHFFFYERGKLLADTDRYDQAIEDFGKAIKLIPNNPAYYFERGKLFAGTGRFSQAMEDFSKAIDFVPDNPVYYSYRSNLLTDAGNYDLAIEDLSMIISLEGGSYTPAYYKRGGLYAQTGKYEDAVSDFSRGIAALLEQRTISKDLAADLINLYKIRGETYKKQDKRGEAAEDLATARAYRQVTGL